MEQTKKAPKTSGKLIGRIVLLQDYSAKRFRLVKVTSSNVAEVLYESDRLNAVEVHCAANGIKCPKPIIDFS